ncbi:GNAT family N-acetyltransferase [Agromyces sp. NPDC058126]|uniref:GNAT family N-acetyltransferase n=1 Tax=Agromyces sp. NPDC058126 TaxID=3346350 RepID=UPI0036DDC8A0
MPVISRLDPADPTAVVILRRYLDDIITRYYGRAATDAEIDEELAQGDDDELQGDRGAFFVASEAGQPLGCAGARYLDADTAELTRVFVAPEARGLGLGAVLVRTVEDAATRSGRTTIRLDTRNDLVEARALYAKLGYAEVTPFNESPYAEHWFAKSLTTH